MDENVAGLLCYAGGWLTGLVFLLTDKRPFVRFHAAQSVVVFGSLNILYLLLIYTLPSLTLILYLAIMAVWVTLMFKAYQHLWYEFPLVAQIAPSLPPAISQPFAERALQAPRAEVSNVSVSNASASSAPASSGSLPGVSRAGGTASFDPKKAIATTAQLVGFIGRWTEADANKIMGTPLKQSPLDDSHQSISYRYLDYTHQHRELELTFNNQTRFLEMASLSPADLRLEEMKQVLGDKFVFSEITGTPWRTLDYTELHVGLIVDQNDKVWKIVFSAGADPTLPLSTSKAWPLGIPWITGQLVAPEALPNFS